MVMLNAAGPNGPRTEDDFGGRARPAPGRYHAIISLAEEKESKRKGTPGLEVEFEVVCDGMGPDKKKTAGQAGKKIPLFLSYISDKGDDATQTCIDRVTRLALCCGVLRPGENKEVDWSEAIGRELVVEIEEQQYDDEKSGTVKKGTAVAFAGFWSLANKAVADVPKDATSPGMQALAKSGGPAVDKPAGNGNGNGANGNGAGGTVKKSRYADL